MISTDTSDSIHAHRDVIMGDQYNISQVIQGTAFIPPPNLADLRAAYLAYLLRTYRVLDFKGIPQLETFSRELPLEDVYVPLIARPERPEGETWVRGRLAGRMLKGETLPDEMLALTGKAEAAAPIPVEQALGKHPRVVVLGDPGSGKSTLLKYLTLRLAAERGAPLPILVPLNAYARTLEREDVSVQDYLPKYFAGLTKGIAALQPLFDAALEKGQAVILLDGLDEVQANRPRLVHKVEAFAADALARGNKLVVTSRIVGYKDAPLDPKHWALHTLLDFDANVIAQFAERWCLAFEKSTLGDTAEARATASRERRDLLAAIESNTSLQRLASNPLLLTILALIKRQNVTLPNHRAELYEIYLETLIRAWNKARALDREQVGPELKPNEILAALGPLALWLREENPTAGVVSEEALLGELTRYYMGEDWGMPRGPAREKARAFLDSVRRYSNLLVERGQKQYGFLHLTFEEMLAAYGLYQKGQLDLQASLTLIQTHLTDPGWWETILLAVGVWGLANRQPRVAGKVVDAMLTMECPAEQAGQNILIAGACLEDVGEEGMGRATAQKVQEALLTACRNRALPPAVQRDAGFSLARTGWRPDDLDKFICIPAGPFLYGGEYREPEKRIIEHPFEIAKYPVTNLQYQRFINAGGYDEKAFWSTDGWGWRTGTYDNKAKEDNEKRQLARRPVEKRSEPYYWNDHQWNNPLAPVVGVTWFEAEAYCNWLAKESGKPVRLPTEHEWERAARGTDGREYPWGELFDRRKLNSGEFWAENDKLDWGTWLNEQGYKNASTTIVCQFPEGNSPYEVSDTSGNIFEWINGWFKKEKMFRTLHGGSWINERTTARSAYRYGDSPLTSEDNTGFRVIYTCPF